TLDAAERRAAPDPPGDQLERPRADLLPRAGHADDDRLAPALVAALQRRTHHVDVADALERIVHATTGELDDHLLDRRIRIVADVDAIGGAQRLGHREFLRVTVDRDDAPGLRHHRALH